MSSKLNRSAYEKIIHEDVEKLRASMPDCLECNHIEHVLFHSIEVYYPDWLNGADKLPQGSTLVTDELVKTLVQIISDRLWRARDDNQPIQASVTAGVREVAAPTQDAYQEFESDGSWEIRLIGSRRIQHAGGEISSDRVTRTSSGGAGKESKRLPETQLGTRDPKASS